MSSEHHHSEFDNIDYQTLNKDIITNLTTTTWRYWLAVAFFGAIVAYGAVVYYFQTVIGLGFWATNEPIFWGLDLPTFIFWIGFSLSGTLLSALLLLSKSHWRNPVYRAAEISTGIALIAAAAVILTHLGRPWRAWFSMPIPNFRYLWTNFRSPLALDIVGMIAYMTASITFLFVGSVPDFAALRDHFTGWRKKLYTVLSLGWKGTAEQWQHFRRAYIIIACCIMPVAISMHTVTSWVPSMTINPAGRSTIFPFYFVSGALLSGVAGVIMILVLVKKYTNLGKYLQVKYFDHLSKFVLVAAISITYIYLIEVFVPWYKPTNFELMPLAAKVRGHYAPMFWTMVFLNSVVPMSLFFRKIRTNINVLFFIALGIQIAMYFERYMMIIPTQSIGYLPATWISYTPNWVELSLLVWSFAIFIFIYLLVIKIVPVISIFEVKEVLPLPESGSSKVKSAAPIMVTSANLIKGKNGENSIIGVFPYHDDAVSVIKELKNTGFQNIDANSPVPSDQISDLLSQKKPGFTLNPKKLLQIFKDRNIHVVRFSFFGASAFAALAVLLGVGTMLLFPIKTGPMSITPLPPVVYTAGVLASLGGVVVSAIAIFILGRMPAKVRNYDPSASNDRFTIIVSDRDNTNISKAKDIFINYKVEKIIEGESA